MAAYASPFAAVPAFIADFVGRLAMPLFQPGVRMHEGETLDKIANVIRSMLGQNGQAPMPATFSDVYCTGSVYRSFANGLIALAGGGQANATLISAGLARFGTVATAGDSAVLPAASPGLHPIITNGGAQAMSLFPAPGEQINALGANAAFSIPAGRTVVTSCVAPGVWAVGLLATA